MKRRSLPNSPCTEGFCVASLHTAATTGRVTYDLTITAEGIEGMSEASALLTRGCQLGQGALYGEPSSAEDTLALFHDDAGIGG